MNKATIIKDLGELESLGFEYTYGAWEKPLSCVCSKKVGFVGKGWEGLG